MAYSFGANLTALDLETLFPDLGDTDKFEFLGASPAGGKETTNSVSRDRKGNYITATNQQRNEVANFTLTFKAIVPDGVEAEVVLGDIGGEDKFVVTRVMVRQTNTGDAVIEVTMHQHAEGENLHLQQKYTVAIPTSGYGITANPIDVAPGGALKINCIGMEWTAEVQHVDKQNRVGDHLVGFSHGLLISCSQTYVDDESVISARSGWFIDSDVPSEASEDTRSRVIRGHTYQDADV